ncbi:hypothetical protein RRSWK_00775 [Rhodopirellula sp. SWK7]|nr:hypothetical protein RRSWK_00775 [Rhodopirellula sp. SWK7]
MLVLATAIFGSELVASSNGGQHPRNAIANDTNRVPQKSGDSLVHEPGVVV